MKQPTGEQRAQLQRLRQYNLVVDYLADVERDYIERLSMEESQTQIYRIQGSLYVVRKLKELVSK